MKTRFTPLVLVVLSTLSSAALLPAGDLSRYREFRLGSSLDETAKQTGMESAAATVISSRPARIEELDWRLSPSLSDMSRRDSVREIRFRFYQGALFEMMVVYDNDQTSGLTEADMTEAVSGVYGSASTPLKKEMIFNSGYTSTVRTVAQWRDPQSIVSLVCFPLGRGFGLIVSSATNGVLAERAITESERLDRVEAPQRAQEQRQKEAADAQARDDKSRLVNKPGFRP